MIIKGQYTSAEIFTENIEDAALQWVKAQCDHPAFEGVRIVQMPDVHAGNSCNVGTAYRIGAYLNPDHVGVDIGCTISMHRLSSAVAPEDFALLDHRIREAIPTGTEICPKNSLNEKDLFRFLNSQYRKARSSAPDLINEAPRIDASFVSDFCRRIKLQEAIFYKSLGTLGGGNHFIEYGEDEQTHEGWLTIHCGSRNLGVKVANHWHNIAQNPKRAQFVGYLWGDALNGYLSDMVIAQAYALYNHHIIRDRIFAMEYPMLRKGAVEAAEGERFCLPFNMRDGIAVCVGKGNPEWNCSAPHGAGEEFEKSMNGIFSTSVCSGTLDESPQAYKPMEEILRLIEPTAEVITMVRPRLNIKDIPK